VCALSDLSIVNNSGFLFQLAVATAVRSSQNEHGWTVASEEHPWRDAESGDEGFVDIVLERGGGHLVLECKRTRNATWAFLVPNGSEEPESGVRGLWVRRGSDDVPGVRWPEMHFEPRSFQARFCAIRGGGEGDAPMLERLASQLLRALDALAATQFRTTEPGQASYFIPVIVTTARLAICKCDPGTIDLANGEATENSTAFEEVGAVRFRKAFSAIPLGSARGTSLAALRARCERTVLVVNAGHLSTFLRAFRRSINFAGQWSDLGFEVF